MTTRRRPAAWALTVLCGALLAGCSHFPLFPSSSERAEAVPSLPRVPDRNNFHGQSRRAPETQSRTLPCLAGEPITTEEPSFREG